MARQMKDSGVEWIGQIPEDWEIVRIKQLFAEVDERCTKGNEYTLLSVSEYYGVSPKKDHLNEDDMLTRAETLDGYKICRKNDIVMNIMLAWKRALGVSEYVGIISPAYCVYRARQEVCAKYFHYLFRTDIYAELFKQNSTGIIDSRLRLYPDKFLALKCQVPPLEQQEKIVSYLDRKCAEIDAIIAKQQQIIEKLKEYKLSIITEAVTKGLDPNVPMKDSGVKWIGKIPEHWNILKLQAHTRMLTPMRDRPEKLDGDIPWVRIEDYDGKYISTSKEGLGVSLETVNEMNLKIYPVGSILCTSSCDLGKCAIVTRELVSNQRFINIIPDLDTNSDYLYYLMLSNAKRLNHLSTGTIQANLSRKAFEHLMVQFPPFAEQKEIAEYLDKKCETVELSIRKKQELIDRLNLYKKSLIYETVTGKKEI